MNLSVSQPAPVFTPVTLVINSKGMLANILGALVAYGTASTYAENALKAIGLGEFYTGNVRKAAREIAAVIAEESRIVPLPDFTDYLNSVKFKQSRFSKAGSAVAGTEDDMSKGRSYDAGLEGAPSTPAVATTSRW